MKPTISPGIASLSEQEAGKMKMQEIIPLMKMLGFSFKIKDVCLNRKPSYEETKRKFINSVKYN
jgi:hypothetical protein